MSDWGGSGITIGTPGRCVGCGAYVHQHRVYCDACDRANDAEMLRVARYRAAMVAMSRFLVFVWLEALAQGWAATDGCDIEQARDEIGLNEVLGVLVQSGRIRLTWSDS